jgi:hypothetical protein
VHPVASRSHILGERGLRRMDDDETLDDEEGYEEFSFEKPESWRDRYFELTLIGVIVVATVLWFFFWPTSDPCKGAPAGAVVEDPNQAGSFKQCK